MSRISEKFSELKARGEKALIPYIMAGDPDLETTKRLILEIERSGGDIIELGVPFSDPLADGPAIQRAAIRALANKVSLRQVISLVRDVRRETQVPIILMLYYNLILKYGEEKFVKDAVSAGVDGVIVPDLPPDEAASLMASAREHGLDTVFLLAPTSDAGRIKLVSESSEGFIYYVSLTGVTGARRELDAGIEASVRKIKKAAKKPVCVGFGISNAEQAAKVAAWADGVIVGSALVGVIEKAGADAVKEAGRFSKSLKRGVLSGT